jgi:autotransporter strand-loop-strand O-heptosyltransferase
VASIELSFIDYPKVTIESKKELLVKIRDGSGDFSTQKKIKKGIVDLKVPVLREWIVEVFNGEKKVFNHQLKLENQVVFIKFENIALGDSILWPAYIEEFRKKYKCKVYLKTRYSELFEKSYPNITFLKKGDQLKNVDVQITPLIIIRGAPMLDSPPIVLNLEKGELRPKLDKPILKRNIEKKYVCIATHSSSYYKYWLRKNGWNDVIKYLKELGYEVVCIDGDDVADYGRVKMHVPDGCVKRTGMRPLSERINDLHFCEFFIGIGSGLAWLAWAMNKPVVMISGFSNEEYEFKTPYRVINKDVCHGCLRFSYEGKRGDMNDPFYCPEHYGTSRQHECSTEITFEMVKEKITKLISSSSHGPQPSADQ